VERWRYRIVAVTDACERTGLELEQLLCLPGVGVQTLTREYADGGREEAVRLPAELASAHPVPAPAANRVTTAPAAALSEQVENRSAMRKRRH
jgi:hypothetical protein